MVKIHPIHIARDLAHGFLSLNDDRRSLTAVAEEHLIAHRRKLRLTQFSVQLLHHVQHFPQTAAEKIGRALGKLAQAVQRLLCKTFHILTGDGLHPLPGQCAEAALLLCLPCRILQHIVDKGTENGGVHRRLSAFLRLQAVLEEKRQFAGGKFVNPGSGEINFPAI